MFRGPPSYRPLTPWGPGFALAVTVVIVGLSFLGMILLMSGSGGGSSPAGVPASKGAGGLAAGLKSFAVWQILVVLLTLLAAGLRGGRARNVLALHATTGGWRTYGAALLALVGLQVLGSIIQYAIVSGDLYADLRPFVTLVRGSDWPIAAAVIGIGAPLSEELLFRGFLLSALAGSRLGFWGGAVVATSLWTLLHAGYSAAGIVEVFTIGLFLSWLLWRTGSLRVAIFCHAVYNSVVVLALRFIDLPAPQI